MSRTTKFMTTIALAAMTALTFAPVSSGTVAGGGNSKGDVKMLRTGEGGGWCC